MISRVVNKVKLHGISGLLQALIRRIFPMHLVFYSECSTLIKDRIGLEIGGPTSNFSARGLFPVYPIAERVDNINFSQETVWEGVLEAGESFIFNSSKSPGTQYIADGGRLDFIESGQYDFVLSSHTIEHLANPLFALEEWKRVLKPNGLLVMIIPHKEGTFDHRRPVTKWEHLLDDYDKQMGEDDLTHLDEILDLHDLDQDPGGGTRDYFVERSCNNYQFRCLHHHVFNTPLAVKMIDHLGMQILAVEVFTPYHIFIISQKQGKGMSVNNDPFLLGKDTPVWHSPFSSDYQANLAEG